MNYELAVETFQDQNAVRLRLSDKDGIQKAYKEIKMNDHPPSLWEGLFDIRNHIRRYEENLLWENIKNPETAGEILKRLGVFLGKEILGQDIFTELTRSPQRRTLIIKIPSAVDDVLAAAFARVPWEIARIAPDQPTLTDRALIVRVITEDTKQDDSVRHAGAIAANDHLRVLMVYAEASDSSLLAMRLEREHLLSLFYKDILPKKRVQVDALCCGVTESVLREQIRSAGGYHIVHWSGHGHHNLLEIRGQDGKKTYLSGQQLVNLFAESGGFIPQIVFLSACLSGTFVNIKDWDSFHAAIIGKKTDTKQASAPVLPDILNNPAGYTGTALELVKSGVPQVIAMRYQVGDDYARELARQFYKHLLADTGKHPTDSALALARTDLLQDKKSASRFYAVDHATPIMFGCDGRILNPPEKRSDQMKRLRPQPQPLLPANSRELDMPQDFVGRTEELTRLNMQWLSDDCPPIALIQGLAGMGKTNLAAESIHLWHRRFDYVLAFQAKPSALMIDDMLRQIHGKLTQFSQAYSEKCAETPALSVFLSPDSRMNPAQRYERMRYNLLEAMRDEAMLIVLDNFESNLGKIMQKQGFQCSDPQWDEFLKFFASELKSTRSRILMTSRHLPAALADTDQINHIQLGPLSYGEMRLYIQSHPKLNELAHSDQAGKDAVRRVLYISRGHPLIMNRLAGLAHDPKSLNAALDALENKGWSSLPDLFAPMSDKDKAKERQYLEDAAVGSVDYLIGQLSPNAQTLLWVITQANEPVAENLLQGVWSGKSFEDEQLEQIRLMIRFAEQFPEERRKLIADKISPEIKKMLESPISKSNTVPAIDSLLRELIYSGLINCENKKGKASYSFHELVRERMNAWADKHESVRGGKTADQIRIAYGERYKAVFYQLQQSGQENAMEYANEAGRRALVYFVRAKAFDKLSGFASALVNNTREPALLNGVIAELQAVADIVPSGKDRWILRTYLADALRRSGRPDQSLTLYEQSAAEAEAAEIWSDVVWIFTNWAGALKDVGQLGKSNEIYLRGADAHRKALRPEIEVIGRELEAFRIDIMQGKAQEVLPEIEARLTQIRDWYQRPQNGETTPYAPDPSWGHALIVGLDIAKMANQRIENWGACLSLLEETEHAQRSMGASKHELYRTRFNQYAPLMKLDRLNEAQQVLEECLDVFREVNDQNTQSTTLSALAIIWDERGDIRQAIGLQQQALSIFNQLPDPAGRAISHGNLSSYLDKAGNFEDGAKHLLAAIIYGVIATRHDFLSTDLNNLKNRMNRAVQTSTRYELPRISELLAMPAFEALGRFLAQHGVDIAELQGAVDELVEQARQ